MIKLEYQNAETFFAKGYTPNWCKEFFVIKEVKIPFYGHMLLMIPMVKKFLEHFMKNNYKQQINKDLR